MTQTRGERNNNPCSLDYIPSIAWQGQLGIEIIPDGLDETPRFARFDTAQNGIRAGAKQIHIYQIRHALNTVRGIISRWAPPNENSTGAYVNAVAHALGVDPDIPIDTSDPAILVPLIGAVIRQENGRCLYAPELIQSAMESALA